ncbi:MAG TPA: sigma-70 family RNA polymerase sigma factor [Bryobacteraceae bacterium]|nr:sigma-70 family RNA polymerase sigma factor [Bryobacteraceae bacterium]
MAAVATVRQVNTADRLAASGLPGDSRVSNPSGGCLVDLGWALASVRPVQQRRGFPLDQDLDLVERCLSGEEAAWEDLIKTHTRRVYAICYRFTGSSQEAQDLAQEVFLRVFRSLKSFRAGEGSFTVWLGKLTRNLLIDHYRRSRLERASDSIEQALPVLEEKTAISARADGLLAGREASEALQGALQKLSPELRETVILRDLEELEYREIAQVLKVPEGTVKSRLNRGRAELARILRKQKVAV